MEVEYQTEIPQDIKQSIASLVKFVERRKKIEGKDRKQLLDDLKALSLMTQGSISGSVEIEPDRDWYDLD